jgi:predicted DNA-binding transcriptional regulator AlpA
MEAKLIDIHMLSEMTMIHPKTIRKLMKEDPSFPRALSLGPRLTRWRYNDVVSWLEGKQNEVVNDV